MTPMLNMSRVLIRCKCIILKFDKDLPSLSLKLPSTAKRPLFLLEKRPFLVSGFNLFGWHHDLVQRLQIWKVDMSLSLLPCKFDQ